MLYGAGWFWHRLCEAGAVLVRCCGFFQKPRADCGQGFCGVTQLQPKVMILSNRRRFTSFFVGCSRISSALCWTASALAQNAICGQLQASFENWMQRYGTVQFHKSSGYTLQRDRTAQKNKSFKSVEWLSLIYSNSLHGAPTPWLDRASLAIYCLLRQLFDWAGFFEGRRAEAFLSRLITDCLVRPLFFQNAKIFSNRPCMLLSFCGVFQGERVKRWARTVFFRIASIMTEKIMWVLQ